MQSTNISISSDLFGPWSNNINCQMVQKYAQYKYLINNRMTTVNDMDHIFRHIEMNLRTNKYLVPISTVKANLKLKCRL